MSAELYDHSFRFFMLDNIIDILPEHRLKIELVSGIKVCRYRLRVTVDHNSLITALFGSQYPMYAAVVELNSLSYTVRP